MSNTLVEHASGSLSNENFIFTKTGLVIEGVPTFEEWSSIGEMLQYMQGAIHWLIGDWLRFGEHAYGKMYAQAIELTGYAEGTLQNDVWIASVFDSSRRRELLSWKHHREVAALDEDQQDYWLDRCEAESWSTTKLRNHLKKSRALTSSESNEWYTPQKYIESARHVMGDIDVDPASNPRANKTIQAQIYYTKETNGLNKEWPGRVWLNPPYGGIAADFIARLVEQHEAGITTEAVVLVNANSTETKWFAPLWDHTLCFTDHRINFETPGDNDSGSTHGSVFVYLGDNIAGFATEFNQYGYVVRRYEYP